MGMGPVEHWLYIRKYSMFAHNSFGERTNVGYGGVPQEGIKQLEDFSHWRDRSPEDS